MISLYLVGDELVIAKICAAQYRSGIDMSTVTNGNLPAISARLLFHCHGRCSLVSFIPNPHTCLQRSQWDNPSEANIKIPRLDGHQFKRDGCFVYILPTIDCY